MTLMRWSPNLSSARGLVTFHDQIDRLFDSVFTRGSIRGDDASTLAPAVDVEETPEAFIFRCDLPGVAQKDVKVSLMGDTLTIRGERLNGQSQAPRSDGNYRRVERRYGVFERSFTLGARVRNDQVKAQYRDGVLEITVPKAEQAKLREIEVQVG
ncbi:MAG TPA: Hsp20/alpha crystallin family protein [Candidatus Limnocylindria bacterium]|nr:Hsp20/alpha crystallin family protein [Candidatus Limnocylindria bacterium]